MTPARFLAHAAILLPLNIITWMLLWFWFVVPFGLPPLNWAHALGLITVRAYLLPSKSNKTDDLWAELDHRVRGAYVSVVWALTLGWVAHFWIGGL